MYSKEDFVSIVRIRMFISPSILCGLRSFNSAPSLQNFINRGRTPASARSSSAASVGSSSLVMLDAPASRVAVQAVLPSWARII